MKNHGAQQRTNQSVTTPNSRRLGSGVKWLIAVAVGLAAQAGAATIRVPQDQATITAAVAAASPGDTIAVSPGTYNEYNIPVTKPVTVTSVGSATNTIVDMQHNGRGFMITNASQTAVNILGLTIQNAQIPYYNNGGSVLIASGKCRISGCIIQGNSGPADYSSAPIYNWSTNTDDVVVDNCIVRNNFAANGAAIGGAAVIRCIIYGNTGGNNCMALYGCHVTNCTIYGNSGGYVGAGNGGDWVNCIVWGNSPFVNTGQQIAYANSVNYCLVQAGFAGTGNLSSDPLFVNAAAGDFHLQTNSPAKNSGNPTILNVDGSRSDMGAYGGNFPQAQEDLTFIWTKLLSSTNMPSLNGDTGWRSLPGSMDESRRIIYSLSQNGVFWKYDIASNLFTQLPVSGTWPGPSGTFIYNPEENSIWFTLYGRGQVFRLPVTGGAFTSVGASGASYSDFGDITYWNQVTHKFATFNGYGFMAVRNWRWEFGTNDSDWVQTEPNTPGRQPWPRAGGSCAVDNIGQRVFHGGGEGNSTGSQGQVDSGFDYFMGDTRFDALRDLWLLDLKSNKWVNLIPLNTAIRHFAPLVYFPPLNMLLMINGRDTTPDASFVNGVWTFAIGQDTNFTKTTPSGTIPNASDDPDGLSIPYYDSLSQRVIYFNTNGVYALSLTSPPVLVVSNANYGLITNQGPTFAVATTNGTMLEEFDYTVTGPFDHTTPALQNGNIYKLTISGRVSVGPNIGSPNSTPDVAYMFVSWQDLDLVHVPTSWICSDWDGIASRRPFPDVYNTNHVYDYYVMGAGAGLAFTFRDSPYSDNIGSFHVKIFNLGSSGVITPPPSITTQPVSQSVNQGSPVSFSVVATGTGLGYQWRFNSANISAATNASYNIASATTNNAGTYTVLVSNAGGGVTSSNAVLTVWSTNSQILAGSQSLLLPPTNFELIQAIQDQVSRIWVLGAFSNSVTVGTNTFTSRGQRDVVLIQYSQAGVVNWAATIGGVYDDVYTTGYVPGAVRMTVQSNICVVAGFENSSLTVVDGINATNNTAYNAGNKTEGSDGYLLTFNSAGSLVWKASVTGTSATDGGQFTAIDSSGNVYWAGTYNGCCPAQGGATVTDGLGSSTSITTPSYGTGFLIKFSSAGAYQWSAKCYSRDASFESGVAVDNAGSVLVAGYSRAISSGTATTLVDAGGNIQSVANGGVQSTFLAKFTSNGIYQWSLSTPGGPDNVGYVGYSALTAATNGDVFVAGTYNTVGLNFGGQSPQLPVPNGQDGFVGCISSSGLVKWLTQFGGAGDQTLGSIYLLSNSQVLAAGRTTNGLSMAATNLTGLGGADGFVVTLSTNGSPLNATLIGQANDNDVRNAQGTTSGVTMIAGQTAAGFQAYGITFTNAGAYLGLVTTSSNPPPSIISQPVSQSVNQGSPVSFSVVATGTGLGYQWRLNSANISAATNASYSLASATTNNAGTYSVIVSNTAGSVTSSNAVLTVIPPPNILSQPVSQSVNQGSPVSFSVVATGTGLGYQWRLNTVSISGATNASYNIASATTNNAGTYSVIVSNTAGSVTSSNAVLTVIPPPNILSQPVSQSVNQGSPVSFSVVATGAGLGYQWRLNSANISGATNASYSLASATANNAGTYSVVVSNTAGSVTSSNAVLTVILPPRTGTGTASMFGVFVVAVNITDGGSGYPGAPRIRLIGGGGSGAQAVAVVSNGVITSITMLNAGYGYTNAPLVVIDPPFIPNPALGIAPMSFLAFTNLTVGGTYQLQRSVAWYWSNQPVSFTATNTLYTQTVAGVADSGDYRLVLNPVPAQAFATPQMVNGFVVGATVTSGGSGYFTSPAVSIVGGGGTNATAVAHTSATGVVTNISILNAGYGYTNQPTIQIAAPPAAAAAPAVQPVMRVVSTNLAPYNNYQMQFKPAVGGAWGNWADGWFTPTDVTNSQYLFITNGAGFFRLQYVP